VHEALMRSWGEEELAEELVAAADGLKLAQADGL
jgi:hypothetical protein